MNNLFKVLPIKKHETHQWFLKKHYAKRIPQIIYCFGLYNSKNILSGVISFAQPSSRTLMTGAFGGKYIDSFLELNRLVINENLPKNTASFFIAKTFNFLPKPCPLVSYSDINQGHNGYIYQATNWIYTGLSAKFKDYAVKGLEHMHHSSIEDSVGRYDENKNINKHELLRKKYGDRLYMKERPRKHRYFYFLGNKKEKALMNQNLQYKVEPYPKGNNKRYDASYVPSVQGVLF